MAVLSVAKIIAHRSLLKQFQLLKHTSRSLKQARADGGCLEAMAVPDGKGVFFAISLWDSEAALMAYVRAGAHGDAAKASKSLALCHVSAHQEWDAPLPAWDEVAPLLADARIIDVQETKMNEEEKKQGPRRPYRNVLRA